MKIVKTCEKHKYSKMYGTHISPTAPELNNVIGAYLNNFVTLYRPSQSWPRHPFVPPNAVY